MKLDVIYDITLNKCKRKFKENNKILIQILLWFKHLLSYELGL